MSSSKEVKNKRALNNDKRHEGLSQACPDYGLRANCSPTNDFRWSVACLYKHVHGGSPHDFSSNKLTLLFLRSPRGGTASEMEQIIKKHHHLFRTTVTATYFVPTTVMGQSQQWLQSAHARQLARLCTPLHEALDKEIAAAAKSGSPVKLRKLNEEIRNFRGLMYKRLNTFSTFACTKHFPSSPWLPFLLFCRWLVMLGNN